MSTEKMIQLTQAFDTGALYLSPVHLNFETLESIERHDKHNETRLYVRLVSNEKISGEPRRGYRSYFVKESPEEILRLMALACDREVEAVFVTEVDHVELTTHVYPKVARCVYHPPTAEADSSQKPVFAEDEQCNPPLSADEDALLISQSLRKSLQTKIRRQRRELRKLNVAMRELNLLRQTQYDTIQDIRQSLFTQQNRNTELYKENHNLRRNVEDTLTLLEGFRRFAKPNEMPSGTVEAADAARVRLAALLQAAVQPPEKKDA